MSSPYIFSRYILWIADANIDFINAPLHFARHAAHSNYSQLDPEVRSLNTSISDNYESHLLSGRFRCVGKGAACWWASEYGTGWIMSSRIDIRHCVAFGNGVKKSTLTLIDPIWASKLVQSYWHDWQQIFRMMIKFVLRRYKMWSCSVLI